jgi:hypothetical protein
MSLSNNVQSCLQLKFKFEIAQRAKSDSFSRLCKSTFAQFKSFFQTSNSDVFHSNWQPTKLKQALMGFTAKLNQGLYYKTFCSQCGFTQSSCNLDHLLSIGYKMDKCSKRTREFTPELFHRICPRACSIKLSTDIINYLV